MRKFALGAIVLGLGLLAAVAAYAHGPGWGGMGGGYWGGHMMGYGYSRHMDGAYGPGAHMAYNTAPGYGPGYHMGYGPGQAYGPGYCWAPDAGVNPNQAPPAQPNRPDSGFER